MATESEVHPDRAGPRWSVAGVLVQRGFPSGTAPVVAVLGTLAVLAGAGLIVTTAAIHLHLYLSGYRHVPRLGVLFLLQAVCGFVLAPVLAWGRHVLLVLVAAGYMAASAIGLILSDTVGFVGIHDSISVPWATPALVIELIGFVVLGAGAALAIPRHLARR